MPKVAFLFPGQGSQYVSMGKTLHDNFSLARELFGQANENHEVQSGKIMF